MFDDGFDQELASYLETFELEAQDKNVEDKNLRVFLMRENIKMPERTSPGAAGFDAYLPHDVIIPANSQVKIDLGFAVIPPAGCYVRLAGRSGLAARYGFVVAGGVIDADYRGEISVVVVNPSSVGVHALAGHRICQLICERYAHVSAVRMSAVDFAHCSTLRNASGFGSSGQ